ncbi:2-dehydro-3-deoxy-6-phosphogalactonate aldolase [Dactylosporangium fulvum]|uniref:Bifunctional 4-hydroxy-2-oxoglutarate aldolase/2-dehydro-3-deoxy-phosphogluconate aldolase n=1 Tax=Dactylosporangium fulvum TaxID=53359 RepID=A0ABY5W102_9ACTN|nr:bifunctional 4-hydroxy-2-oxoglutarate aldolase/2-dehydro-3-deoxy-phosphogluconate aldolase [Dactylosporangium fulvum]UWP83124.1 bifunctional 4-hydroxy-2-oxoglutarate aldolase/2-dehydro-3-deoxy-phosphogluconate aldolase [Dactylosporangium fulvum]
MTEAQPAARTAREPDAPADGFDRIVGAHRIMAILRGYGPAETAALAHRIWDAGIGLLEVPIGTPDALPALRAAVAAGAERGRRVGAGTVLTPEQVRAAATAGAQYTVAPGLDLTVLAASLAAGLPHLPGVGTASEVQQVRAAGCRWVKAFPASALGPSWVTGIAGPFPDVAVVATGGLRVADAAAWLSAGARVVALGAALADPTQVARLSELVPQVR